MQRLEKVFKTRVRSRTRALNHFRATANVNDRENMNKNNFQRKLKIFTWKCKAADLKHIALEYGLNKEYRLRAVKGSNFEKSYPWFS